MVSLWQLQGVERGEKDVHVASLRRAISRKFLMSETSEGILGFALRC